MEDACCVKQHAQLSTCCRQRAGSRFHDVMPACILCYEPWPPSLPCALDCSTCRVSTAATSAAARISASMLAPKATRALALTFQDADGAVSVPVLGRSSASGRGRCPPPATPPHPSEQTARPVHLSQTSAFLTLGGNGKGPRHCLGPGHPLHPQPRRGAAGTLAGLVAAGQAGPWRGSLLRL